MKRVIITGGNSGLGLELSNTFLNKGIEVISLSRNKADNQSIHISTDLTDQNSINKTINIILEKYSDFDALILCAGGGFIEEMSELDSEHTENTIALNLTSNINLTDKLLPIIKKNGSDIAVIGATIGYKSNQYMPVYSIAKWGLRGFVENIRDFCKGTKSRVLHISPGGMNTESNIGKEGRETIIAEKTGKAVSSLIDAGKVAELVYNFLSLPKNMEISEIIINRK